jgi:hypothetical protein
MRLESRGSGLQNSSPVFQRQIDSSWVGPQALRCASDYDRYRRTRPLTQNIGAAVLADTTNSHGEE